MSEENVNPNLEKMLNDQKWSFSAKPFEGSKSRPKLSFGVYMGNPNLVVFTNHPSDQGKKPLRLGLDMKTLGSYAQFIIDFAKTGKPGEAYALECSSGAPNALKREGDFIVGKEQDGVIYIGAVKEGYTNIKFHILPPMHHSLRSASGEALSKARLSEVWTVGYFTELVPVVRKLVELTYRAPEPRQGGGGYQKGGGGGGYQKGGYNNGGGGYQKPQGGYQKPQGGGGGYGDYDDDIPM